MAIMGCSWGDFVVWTAASQSNCFVERINVTNQYLPILYICFLYILVSCRDPLKRSCVTSFMPVVYLSGHGVSYSTYWSVLFYCLITSFKLPYCRPGRQWPRCLPDRYEQLRFWVTLFPTRCKLNYFILFQFNYGSVFLHCCGVYINYFFLYFLIYWLYEVQLLNIGACSRVVLCGHVSRVCAFYWDINTWYTCIFAV